jgi:organic hydroperoxide reductase OsmC/OhrA
MRMSRVTLQPCITIAEGSDESLARALVETAHQGCFIANSITAVVQIEPTIAVATFCSELLDVKAG